jgi:cyclic-di-GMP-binding protein
MPSFDIVSQIDFQEVDNALTQSQKEIAQRFDFKNTQTTLAWAEDHKSLVLKANSEGRVQAAGEVLQSKLVKRSVPLKAVTFSAIEPAGGQMQKQTVTFQQGIPVEKGKEIARIIKESKLKVQAAIQGEQLRVSGKSRDDLQEAMALVRGHDFGVDVQFNNFRD